ncbi:MAG: hypothetical protein ACRDZ4_20395 [Egibacteraceae bacterium]
MAELDERRQLVVEHLARHDPALLVVPQELAERHGHLLAAGRERPHRPPVVRAGPGEQRDAAPPPSLYRASATAASEKAKTQPSIQPVNSSGPFVAMPRA